jgi:hypothetical protein
LLKELIKILLRSCCTPKLKGPFESVVGSAKACSKGEADEAHSHHQAEHGGEVGRRPFDYLHEISGLNGGQPALARFGIFFKASAFHSATIEQ